MTMPELARDGQAGRPGSHDDDVSALAVMNTDADA